MSVFCELWITGILELRLSRCLVFLSPRVTRYGKQRREKGHMQPKAIPGRPSKQRAQVEAGMLPQLQAHDDATLEQHGDLWEQTHGERVSRWTMSRAIKRLGWTRKKSRSGPRSESAGRMGYLASEREQASERITGMY